MNIEHLKMFVNVVERGSISLISQTHNISQSALSQQIQNLEKHFNIKLLARSHKGVVPTAAGKIVYEQSVKLLENYETIFTKLDLLSVQCQNVKIIATPIAYSYALPCTFFCFRNTHPECHLEMESDPSAIVEEKILSGQGDMGVVATKSEDKRLKCRRVFSDKIMLVAGANFEIPATIQKEDLFRYPMLTLTHSHKTQQIIDQQLESAAIDCHKLNILYSLDSAESLKLSALNGFGLAFLPYMAIKKELYTKQLRVIQCGDLNLDITYYSITLVDSIGDESTFMVNYIEKILEETIC